MAKIDPFVVQWPQKWVEDPEIGPVINYLNRFLHDLFILTTDGTGDSLIAELNNTETLSLIAALNERLGSEQFLTWDSDSFSWDSDQFTFDMDEA